MEDSLFLHSRNSGKQYAFKQFGCCEGAGSWFTSYHSNLICELIKLDYIIDPILSNPDVIEEYLNLISEFLNIPIERVSNPSISLINNFPFSKTANSEKEWNEEYISFKIGKYLSNKHFVAMHTLIRYLWYHQLEYHPVINAVLNLRRLSPKLPIEDVFAIAHSFQERTTRALTGRNNFQKFGFMYFNEKDTYLKGLKEEQNFNSVFDGNDISIIPKIKIKGSFFDESEMIFDSKQFISFLTTLDESAPLISVSMYNSVIESYLKYKDIYKYLIESIKHPNLCRNRILKCDISTTSDNLESIDFIIADGVTGRNKSSVFKNFEELKDFITNMTVK